MHERGEELISVIIPVYNVADYLRHCIDSVIAQTYTKIEILLIDDGSVDESGVICEQFAAKDDRISVYHKENGGLSSARNFGMKKAMGSIFAFVDSDDYIHSRMLETLYENMIRWGADISVGEYQRVEENQEIAEENLRGETICKTPQEACALLLGKDAMFNTGVVCNKLFRRQLFQDLRFPEGRLHEDEFVIHHLLGNAGNVVYTSDVLYYYTVRGESITGNYCRKRLDVLDAYEDRYRYYKKVIPQLASGSYRRYLYLIRLNYYAYKKNYPNEYDEIRGLRVRHAVSEDGEQRTFPMRLFDRSPLLYYAFHVICRLVKGKGYIWE